MKKHDSAGKLAALILAGLLLIGAGAVYTADVTARGKAIGTEYAVQFARIDAGVDAEDVVEQQATLVRKQGGYVYNVDFSTETGSFAYVVRASDGVILEREGDFEKAVSSAPAPDAGKTEEAKLTPEPDAGKEAGSTPMPAPDSVKDTESTPMPAPGTGGETALIPTPSARPKETGTPVTAGTPAAKPETTPASSVESGTTGAGVPAAEYAGTPSQPSSAPRNYIGVDKAKALAVKAFGLTVAEVTFSTAKLENENGEVIYDLEFFTSKAGYECEIHAMTGEVLEKSVEQFAAEAETAEAVSEAVVGAAPTEPEPAAADPAAQTWEDDSAYDDDDDEDEERYDEDEQDEDSDRYEEEYDDDDDREEDDRDDDDDDDWEEDDRDDDDDDDDD